MVDGHRRGHGVHAVKRAAGDFRVGNFKAVGFVERDDQLEGVHGVKPDTAWAEEWLAIANIFGADLEHEVFHHEPFDGLLEI